MIYETPPLSNKVRSKLETLDDLRLRMSQRLDREMPWDPPLRRFVKGDSYASSTRIEGYQVEGSRTLELVSDKSESLPRNENEEALACYAHAMDHVATLAVDPEFQWNKRVVLDLHFEACRFQKDKRPGLIREGSIRVTSPEGGTAFTAPPASEVSDLLEQLVRHLENPKSSVDPAVEAAMAHLNLVSIHPFEDGNGRISRIVQSLVLARDGQLAPEFGSIEPFLAKNTPAYYTALMKVQKGTFSPERDPSSWIEFCVDAHIEQARERMKLIENAATRWARLEAIVEKRGWEDRLVIALEQTLGAGTDRARYASEADVSNATASSDLRRLLDAGLINQVGKGRSTTYEPAPKLWRAVEEPDGSGSSSSS